MNLNEFEFALNTIDVQTEDSLDLTTLLNVQSLLYPNLSLWDQEKYYVWSRQGSFDKKIAQKSMPRLGFDSRFINFTALKRKDISKCFSGSFPTANCFAEDDLKIPYGTTVLKFEWRAVENGKVLLPKTSKEQIVSMLNSSKTWQLFKKDFKEVPKMITSKRDDGKVFYLAGFHAMTKINDDWFWVTYWLDPNTNDFNNDKTYKESRDEWKPYSMCAVSDYEEKDFSHAQSIYSENNDNFQWCSNPYLESHKKMAATNCIGCHQFAGKLSSPTGILNKEFQGQKKISATFENDYLWSFTQFPAEIGYKLKD
jgi:hypothetical protein